MRDVDDTERKGRELVMPLILSGCKPGSPVIDTNACKQGEFLQRGIGDYLVQHVRTEQWYGVEVKTEKRFTGNLFVEAWSNKKHVRERNGWIFTLRADVLFMVYLDVRAAFMVPLPKLADWCVYVDGAMYKYREVVVHRSLDGEQKNVTTGHLVPWADVPATIGVRPFRFLGGKWQDASLGDIRPLPALFTGT